mmetsp:Transcript_22326/g.33153  ORF Transcript_22326/g.33153 Transcript_22326/m.33153 type:complete len:119 (+) Transcript_22326:253-609(+)|eukprot:CAMPEP_0206426374 /NCGR_PEP_ID=MMETSP0324_2-20121206/4337_1 /ASSEMBLY_ACC=CAM_ASM_000836 /TAXON_ID=2866 /ORGANISM="Crypthecodinium cohnii, Strain Seligo" /LENGTH=118 /DNA_ID=CAMNT_0053891311 /DNA_START=198 /DNA_END=554 /DNA_ORIENTATION=-
MCPATVNRNMDPKKKVTTVDVNAKTLKGIEKSGIGTKIKRPSVNRNLHSPWGRSPLENSKLQESTKSRKSMDFSPDFEAAKAFFTGFCGEGGDDAAVVAAASRSSQAALPTSNPFSQA